jgi:ABC-type amino acid transport substrate-binding protein
MKLVFFKNATREDIEINSFEDAKKVKSIAVAADTISHEKLTELGFQNLDVNKLASYSLKKLQENKTDLYPTEYYSFLYELKKRQLQNKVIPVKMKQPIMAHNKKYYKNTDS